MKTALSLLCASFLPLPVLAQGTVSSPAVPDPEPYAISQIGLDHRVWSRTSWEVAPDGRLLARTNSYTELETSMYYLKDGRLEPSVALIEGFPGGAVARRGPFKAIFANSLATRGAIDVELPDGQRLLSNPLCLMYYDWASGSNAVIANVKDCQGTIVASNQVAYLDAFDKIRGAIRLGYSKAGIEQDIIIEDEMALPPPEAFGIASESATLAAVTEFHNRPQPATIPGERTLPDGVVWPDVTLDFGSARIGRGQALWTGSAPRGGALPVVKDWLEIDGRRVLVEEVPVRFLRRQMAGGAESEGASIRRVGRGEREAGWLRGKLPRLAQRPGKPQKMEVAAAEVGRGGLVLDYIILTGTTNNLVLEGDKTFLINGLVNVFGTLVLEPGVVVKLPISGTASIVSSNVVCDTRSYRPAVLTAADDNSAGEPISGSTGNPSGFYGKVALDLSSATAPVLSNLRFCYLSNAVAGSGVTLEDVQMIKCRNGFASGSTQPKVRNGLIWQVGTLLPVTTAATLTLENVTAHYCTNLLGNTSGTVNLTNCLLAGVGNWQCTTTRTNGTVVLSSDAGVFQVAGGGAHYLAEGSPYRQAGTTNVNAGLLARLASKTTYPPIVYSNATFDVQTTLGPQAQRCLAGAPPIGYAYDALDLAFGGCKANQNLTFAPGTAVGWFRTSSGWYHAGHGINLADGKVVTFDGRAEAPDYWVRANTVQEGCNGLWQGGYGPGGITGSAWPAIGSSPELVARFTRFSMLGVEIGHYRDDYGWLTVRATGCEFGSGQVASYNMRHYYTNCLWERSHLSMQTDWPDSAFAMRNCTMRAGGLSPYRFGNGVTVPVVIQDSAFDATGIYNTAINTNVTYYDYNAFAQGANRISPAGANDVIVTNFNWQTGWRGNAYLPTNSPLINAGSTWATNMGFYHFATTTNQVKEGSSKLDIGFHVVAVNAQGNPVDGDQDGLPDYFEDTTGEGVYNTGDLANFGAADTDGDGVNDWVEYLQGRQPKVAGAAADAAGSNRLTLFTPLR